MNTEIVRGPYSTADDLPTVQELRQQLRLFGPLVRVLKPFSQFLPAAESVDIAEIKRTLENITRIVDAFYELLGPLGWVYHDTLSLSDMDRIVTDYAEDPRAAEAALIEWYQSEGTLNRLALRLHGHKGLRARLDLLRLAQEDYKAERYYAVVHVLLSVTDGFVNDLAPNARKGLHAHDAEDMNAWDTVTSVHGGLASVFRTYNQSVRKRRDEPTTDLLRNGIVHGMVTNYNNTTVATKAWNMLFAVSDWAKAREAEREKLSGPPTSTLAEAAQEFLELARNRKADDEALESFVPVTLNSSAAGFREYSPVSAATEFLDAWSATNYGAMATRVGALVGPVPIGQVRREFSEHPLKEYEILTLSQEGLSRATTRVRLLIDNHACIASLDWLREVEPGEIAAPRQSGEWRLAAWTVAAILRDSEPTGGAPNPEEYVQ